LENYLGKLVLRLTLGGLLLLHGVAKIYTGPASIMERVARLDLPSALAYLVYAGEVLAPLLLIAGLWTRAAGLLVAINMVVAVLLVHTDQLGALNRNGGWALELQGFYFLTAVAIMLLGPGKLSVDDIERVNRHGQNSTTAWSTLLTTRGRANAALREICACIRRIRSSIKAAAILLSINIAVALVVAGIVYVHLLTSHDAAAAIAPASSRAPAAASSPRFGMAESPARDSLEQILQQSDNSRECEPSAGIESDCIFN
jgi:putative oxidoreductase